MQSSNNEKTLNARLFGDSREEGTNRNSNPFQEKEKAMTSSISHNDSHFDTRFTLPSINVGNITIRAGHLTGGDEPDTPVVALDVPDRDAAMTPAQALSVIAAMQSVTVHLMEDEARVITRRTAPGAPEHDGIGGGL